MRRGPSFPKHTNRRILLAAGTSWYLWNFRRNVIRALSQEGAEVVTVAPQDEYSTSLAALPNVRWMKWPIALDGASPVREFLSFLRYLRFVRQIRPDFVINHGIKANVYGGLMCRLLSIPYANNVTGLGMMLTKSGLGPRALGKLYAFACNRAHVLFIQNYDDLAELRGAGLSKKVTTVRTIGSGVDLAHFPFATMPSRMGRTFLFVGRLQRDKGIWDFVEAARTVRAEYPDARFIAVGSQTFTNRGAVADEILSAWKREAVVEFVGHHDDVRPWLRKAHVMVLPSRREGMPRAILEAAAIGRPAISYDVTGCRDAVIPGQTGWLCPPQDVAALIDAMREVCRTTDEELASKGRAARRDAEARFADTQLIEATLAAVEAAV
jgi:glycosyltransferase involved in cell wall biosynthesis